MQAGCLRSQQPAIPAIKSPGYFQSSAKRGLGRNAFCVELNARRSVTTLFAAIHGVSLLVTDHISAAKAMEKEYCKN
jgi:hypothetical protein